MAQPLQAGAIGGAGPAMKATIDIRSDLQTELRRLRSGEVWVVTYSIHRDVFEALFAPFRDLFTIHILVYCGGICPSRITEYGRELIQIHDASLHAKLVFIEPREPKMRPIAYFLTGNIRHSLVDHENQCVKIELSPRLNYLLKSWLKNVRNGTASGKPFLLTYDVGTKLQEQINCKSLGSGILTALNRARVVIRRIVLLSPWGCNYTVKRLIDEYPSVNRFDMYAGCNVEEGDFQKNTWVAAVPSPDNCTMERFAQSRKTRLFIHAKAAMFRGLNCSRPSTLVYIGSGNLTKRGFWDPKQNNHCPNVECGILLKSTGKAAGRLSDWFSRKIIGSATRWKRLPPPKTNPTNTNEDIDTNEEFMEDEEVLGLKRNGFERRRLAKIIDKALRSREYLGLLRQLFLKTSGTGLIRKSMARMLYSYCRNHGGKITWITLATSEILERYTDHTRVGLTFDTDSCRGIYIVINIPGELPRSKEEIRSLIKTLTDFETGRSGGNGDHSSGVKEEESTEEKKVNVRFPYRKYFVWRDNLRKNENGEEDFVRRMKHKVTILDKLGDGQIISEVPLWWKSILIKILNEEQ
jgi:hypothetical protein